VQEGASDARVAAAALVLAVRHGWWRPYGTYKVRRQPVTVLHQRAQLSLHTLHRTHDRAVIDVPQHTQACVLLPLRVAVTQ
jgi:hypothetical protein